MVVGVAALNAGIGWAADKPNLLWITVEDMSPTLGCYGDAFANTPEIDQFAKEGVRYTHAFAASPVCSPSRSCLITGLLPASMGTQQMRSALPLPTVVRGFPAYLREAGYFCTNNVKTDYNNADEARLIEESWDESSPTAHWRDSKRKEGQPFFSIFNDMTTHQSRTMVWPYAAFQKHVQSELSASEIHDPAKVPLPPYYPDTPLVRREVARFYDCVTAMDHHVGKLLAELEEDGLAEDTIVFFYSDHGSGMPRHKRLLHDSGMQVPLIIRFPEKYQHLAPAAPGETIDELVSFVDFPPTVLKLTGLPVPEAMQGRAMLGPDAGKAPEYVYGSRDRVDEAMDLTRSLRDQRWLYIRNYHPELGWAQPSVFSDLGEIQREIRDFGGQRTEAQAHYVRATRPIEEFYDCESDPLNVTNLAISERTPEQEAALDRMRAAFRSERSRLLDVGAIPEPEMWRWIRDEEAPMRDILEGKTQHRPDFEAIWAAADLVGKGDFDQLKSLLDEGDPGVRYWGVIGLRHAAFADEAIRARMVDHLLDSASVVRIEAAGWLAEFEESREAALEVLREELQNPDWWTALRACRAIELLGPKAISLQPVMRELYDRTRDGTTDGDLFLAFSSGAFLQKLGEPTKAWDFTPEAQK